MQPEMPQSWDTTFRVLEIGLGAVVTIATILGASMLKVMREIRDQNAELLRIVGIHSERIQNNKEDIDEIKRRLDRYPGYGPIRPEGG